MFQTKPYVCAYAPTSDPFVLDLRPKANPFQFQLFFYSGPISFQIEPVKLFLWSTGLILPFKILTAIIQIQAFDELLSFINVHHQE